MYFSLPAADLKSFAIEQLVRAQKDAIDARQNSAQHLIDKHNWLISQLSEIDTLLYAEPSKVDPDKWVGLMRFVFTVAVVRGDFFDEVSMPERWCYRSHALAVEGFQAWDQHSEDEPTGWRSNPGRDRKRANCGTITVGYDPRLDYSDPSL